MFSPSVITSKAASKDLENIRNTHTNLLTGLANQAVKVNSYNQQKQAELQAKNTIKAETQKENIAANTQAHKDSLDFAMKQSELDIKRAQLSMKT